MAKLFGEMEINNLQLIKPLLNFANDDVFYHLQILKRKKEHPSLGSNSYVVKTYYISSIEYLEFKMSEIIELCKFHQARAYINLIPRSFEKIAFHTLKKVTDCIMNKDYKSVRKAYESVCGEFGNGTKRWVIDIDVKDFEFVDKIGEIIDTMKSGKEDTIEANVLGYIPTKNGWHIITRPFNLKQFEPYKVQCQLDIHKNNPTILYCKLNGN